MTTEPRYGKGPRSASTVSARPTVTSPASAAGSTAPGYRPTSESPTDVPSPPPADDTYKKVEDSAPPKDDEYSSGPSEGQAGYEQTTEPPDDTGKTYGPDDPTYGKEGPAPPPQPEKPAHPCPPSMTCDTGAIDDLQCHAKGVKAEADSLAEVAKDLTGRRTAFETARTEYSKARDSAASVVKELNRRLSDLTSDIKCQLNAEEIDCVDQAFQQVEDCLVDDTQASGCCVDDDCGFGDASWTPGQIEDLLQRVVKIEKCFDEELVNEPTALTTRVTDAQKVVDQLATDMKETPTDPIRLYARAKAALGELDSIWGRFADVNDYQECLCCGFTCSLKGRQLLAELAADKAYEECQALARENRRKWLQTNIVEETLAAVLVVCPPEAPCAPAEDALEATAT